MLGPDPQICSFALAQAARAFFRTSPQQHVISFARTKETKQRKFAVCTFWATPASVSAKQKELADAQTASALAAGAFHFFARTKKRNKEIRRLPLQS